MTSLLSALSCVLSACCCRARDIAGEKVSASAVGIDYTIKHSRVTLAGDRAATIGSRRALYLSRAAIIAERRISL